MDELLLYIEYLPELQLSNEEWLIFANIFSSLEKKTPAKFVQTKDDIKNELHFVLFPSVSNNEIKKYLHCWLEVSNLITKLMDEINQVWQLFIGKLIDSDNLLDVCILLLPNKSFSADFLNKIDIASQLTSGKICYAFTILHSAIQAKSEVNLYVNPDIKFVVNILNKTTSIRNLIYYAKKYESELINTITNIIKKQDALAFTYYFDKNPPPEPKQIMNDIIEAIHFKNNMLACINDVAPFLRKFVQLQDFQATLHRKNMDSQFIAVEFAAKYEHYQRNLDVGLKNYNNFLDSFNHFFDFEIFRKKSYEEVFFTAAESFSEGILNNQQRYLSS